MGEQPERQVWCEDVCTHDVLLLAFDVDEGDGWRSSL